MQPSDRPIIVFRPDILLMLEGFVFLIVCCVAYQHFYAGHWLLFAALFLVPDIALFAYAFPNKKFAAAVYNIVHSYVIPVALGLIAWHENWKFADQIMLIWLAHISFDRMLGFGLKFPEQFRHTHIQSSASGPVPAKSDQRFETNPAGN